MRTLIRLLTRHPVTGLVGVALLTACLVPPMLGLSIREELDDYWHDDDPEYRRLQDALELFGLEGGGVLGLEFDGPVFTHENLERIDEWTRRLEEIDEVQGVLSLTTATTVKGSEEGIEVAPLVPDPIPAAPARLAALEREARDDPDLAGRLVSADGRSTAIFVSYSPEDLDYAGELAIGEAIWKLARAAEVEHPDVRFYPTGSPAFMVVFKELTRREIRTLYPAVVLGMVVLLWLSFRDVRATVVPLVVIVLATVWTLGLLGLTGRFLNSTTVVIPAVVIVISVADTIHIINQYFESVRAAGPGALLADRPELMARTLERVLFPCFLTTATTVVGFLSLLLVDVPVIQDIGVFVTLGILSAFAVSVTLVPSCYVLSPLPAPRATGVQVSGWIGRLLDRVAHAVGERPRTVMIVAALLGAFGLGGTTRLSVDFQWKEFVKEGHRIREAIRFLDERLGGYDWLTVLLTVPEGRDGDFRDPELLAVAERIQQEMEREDFVGHVDSPVGPLSLANKVLHAGDERERVLPATRELAAQYLLLFDMSASGPLDGVLSFDRRAAQVSARLISPGHHKVRQWMERLAPFVEREAASAGLEAGITGYSAIFSKLNRVITMGLVWSLSGALLVIALIMTATLRSVRLGLASMVPNVIPVMATLGFMGWAGIYLSGQTAMIGCIGIGLAVDDTIHFLHRFHRELVVHRGDRRAAVEATIHSTGRAIVFTSLVLLAGFSILVLSSFVQFTEFGLLTAVTMLTALLGDLLLLPVMLIAFPWLTEPEAAAARLR